MDHRKFFKLSGKIAALNAPNVSQVQGTYPKTVPWSWSADQMLKWVPVQSNHLVFSCHGFHTGRKADFPSVHLSIGTVLHPGNAAAFNVLMSAPNLLVIWIAACSVAGEQAGDNWMWDIARRSGCYVVANSFDTADRSPPWGCVEDSSASGAWTRYFTSDGALLSHDDFVQLGPALGFKRA